MGGRFGGPTMLTTMTAEDWTIVLRVFEASRSRRGDKGRDDRRFLEALQYFVVHNITWRALPEKFRHWNSVWKRFWRLSRSGTFEAFTAQLANPFDELGCYLLLRRDLGYPLAIQHRKSIHLTQINSDWAISSIDFSAC